MTNATQPMPASTPRPTSKSATPRQPVPHSRFAPTPSVLPAPLTQPWPLRTLASAESGHHVLPDGRHCYWIRHQVLKGVTPAMLAWWFAHLEGSVEIAGQSVDRYRAWHPLDHVAARYAWLRADGTVGPGAAIRLTEYLGRNPKYKVDIVTRIEKLDVEGFVHLPRPAGMLGWFARNVVRMEYSFKPLPEGTLYENRLIFGVPGRAGRWFTRLLAPLVFPIAQGKAWLLHNIEEVGNFERFLPALYARETGVGDSR